MADRDCVVPLSIMHQKVYCAGRRLPKWTPLPLPKQPEADLAALRRAIVKTTTGPFIPFEGQREHLFRTYYLGIMPNSAICRACGGVCHSQMQMDAHITTCWAKIGKAILSITSKGTCIVCDDPMDAHKMWMNHRTPLCGKSECIDKWRHSNTAKLKIAMALDANYAQTWNEEE